MTAIACALLVLRLACGDLTDDDRGDVQLKSDLTRAERDQVHALVATTRERVMALLRSLGLKRKQMRTVRLRVYGSADEFEKRRNSASLYGRQPWAAGFFDVASHEVVAPWQQGRDAGQRALRHELTHLVLAEYASSPPLWLDEGLAEYVAAQELDEHGDPIRLVDQNHLARVRDALAGERICPLATLMDLRGAEFYGGETGASTGPRSAVVWSYQTSYAQSWSLVYFLLQEAHDPDWLELVAQRLEKGSWDEALIRRRLPSLEQAWRAFIARRDLLDVDMETAAARQALAAHDFRHAVLRARGALAIAPRRRAARRVLAHASLAMGDLEQAYHACNYLLAEKEADADAQLVCAQALLGLHREDRLALHLELATTSAMRAAELADASRRPECLEVLVNVHEAAGDAKAALATCREALQIAAMPKAARKSFEEREAALVRQLTRAGG